jgi:flagellar basal-body rod protein FlgF
MENTLLISLSHQLASYRSMDVIANNLANMSTPSFKREAVKFEELVVQVPPSEGEVGMQRISFVQDNGVVRDLNEGRLENTGAAFDVAINGNGYFTVQTAGGERYTRNGHFTLDGAGQLVTSTGETVMGDGGAVTITPEDGQITIAADGTVSGRQGQISKLRVVNFANERALVKEGNNLYVTDQPATAATGYRLAQGTLEASNVQPVIEISKMIDVMRAYQATASLTESHEQLLREAIDKLGATPG